MLRLWAYVLVMEIVAVVAAVLAFGVLVLLVGVPLILVSVLVLAVVWSTDRARALQRARSEASQAAAEQVRTRDPEHTIVIAPVGQRGLMSGFFELPGQQRPAPRPVDRH